MFILKIDIFEFYCGIFLMGLFLFVGGVDKFMLMQLGLVLVFLFFIDLGFMFMYLVFILGIGLCLEVDDFIKIKIMIYIQKLMVIVLFDKDLKINSFKYKKIFFEIIKIYWKNNFRKIIKKLILRLKFFLFIVDLELKVRINFCIKL